MRWWQPLIVMGVGAATPAWAISTFTVLPSDLDKIYAGGVFRIQFIYHDGTNAAVFAEIDLSDYLDVVAVYDKDGNTLVTPETTAGTCVAPACALNNIDVSLSGNRRHVTMAFLPAGDQDWPEFLIAVRMTQSGSCTAPTGD